MIAFDLFAKHLFNSCLHTDYCKVEEFEVHKTFLIKCTNKYGYYVRKFSKIIVVEYAFCINDLITIVFYALGNTHGLKKCLKNVKIYKF